jgi:hypothetical protein
MALFRKSPAMVGSTDMPSLSKLTLSKPAWQWTLAGDERRASGRAGLLAIQSVNARLPASRSNVGRLVTIMPR